MHPVFFALATFTLVVLVGVAVLGALHLRVPRRAPRLQPWLDLDGSARRQRQRLTVMH